MGSRICLPKVGEINSPTGYKMELSQRETQDSFYLDPQTLGVGAFSPPRGVASFGNGERKETPNTEEGKRAETQYTMPGLYTVSLTGKWGDLSGTETKIGYIYVETKMK